MYWHWEIPVGLSGRFKHKNSFSSPMQQQKTFLSQDQYPLEMRIYSPATDVPVKAILLINAGFGVAKEWYESFAAFMSEHHFLVVCYDYRGIGGSKSTQLKGTEIRLQDWAQDMRGIHDWLTKSYPQLDIYLLAHSMGSLLPGLSSQSSAFKKIIIIAGNTGNWHSFKPPLCWLVPLGYFLLPLVPFLQYLPAGFNRKTHWLPAGIVRQCKTWNQRDQSLRNTLNQLGINNYFPIIQCPMLILRFTDDPLINQQGQQQLYTNFPNAPIEHRTITPEDYNLKKN